MSRSINIETNAVFCRVAELNDVGPLKVDDLGRKVLNRGLTITENKTQHVIKAGLEVLLELLYFAWSLLLGILLALDFHSFLTAVDLDRLVFRASEFSSLHFGKFDVIRKQIGSAQFSPSEGKETSGS